MVPNIFLTFVLAYLVQLGVPSKIGLIGVILTSAVAVFTLPLFGMLSDRIGRRPVFMGAAAFMLVFAFPYFWLLNTKSPILIVVAMMLSYTIGTMGMLAAELAFFCELFPTVCATPESRSLVNCRPQSQEVLHRSSRSRCLYGLEARCGRSRSM